MQQGKVNITLAPDFRESLLDTVSRIRTGEMKWYSYDEVFVDIGPHDQAYAKMK